MKRDYEIKRLKFPTVFCSSIVENNGGLFVTFTDILTNEQYEHFQVMPGNIESNKAGKSKAETYLRRLARAADKDKDYCILDFTSANHHRSFTPIEGRFFQLKVLEKVALKGSGYENGHKRYYKSAEEIYHYEGDGEFGVYNIWYLLSRNDFNEEMFKRMIHLRTLQKIHDIDLLDTENYETNYKYLYDRWLDKINSMKKSN